MMIELKKFHKQQGSKECWFACYLMVYDTIYGTDSDYQAKKEEINSKSGVIRKLREMYGSDSEYDPFEEGAGDDVVLGLLNENLIGHEYGMLRNDAGHIDQIKAEVKESLSRGYPAVLGEDWNGGGHFYVIVGIEGDEFLVIDPMKDGKPQKKKITGESFTVLYHK